MEGKRTFISQRARNISGLENGGIKSGGEFWAKGVRTEDG